jgi:hypothetical protein
MIWESLWTLDSSGLLSMLVSVAPPSSDAAMRGAHWGAHHGPVEPRSSHGGIRASDGYIEARNKRL